MEFTNNLITNLLKKLFNKNHHLIIFFSLWNFASTLYNPVLQLIKTITQSYIKFQKLSRTQSFTKISPIFTLCVIFLFTLACSNSYKNLSKSEYPINKIQQIPYTLPSYEKVLIYKTNINFYKNDISGLLIIKKINKNIYRIALTTQFGLKIFDFELSNGILNVKYCIESLNKKMILNTFQTDFNLLLMQSPIESILAIENPLQNQKIWQLKSGKLNYNYIQNTESGKIENINYKKRNTEKISVGLHTYKGDIPNNITLEHHNIKLKMNLKLIQ